MSEEKIKKQNEELLEEVLRYAAAMKEAREHSFKALIVVGAFVELVTQLKEGDEVAATEAIQDGIHFLEKLQETTPEYITAELEKLQETSNYDFSNDSVH